MFDITKSVMFVKASPCGKNTKFKLWEVPNDGAGNRIVNFFVIKPNRCTNFTNFIWHETLHVSDGSSVHHQEFIHCTLSNGICHTCLQTAFEQEHMLLLESCLQTCMTYTIAECTVNKLLF